MKPILDWLRPAPQGRFFIALNEIKALLLVLLSRLDDLSGGDHAPILTAIQNLEVQQMALRADVEALRVQMIAAADAIEAKIAALQTAVETAVSGANDEVVAGFTPVADRLTALGEPTPTPTS